LVTNGRLEPRLTRHAPRTPGPTALDRHAEVRRNQRDRPKALHGGTSLTKLLLTGLLGGTIAAGCSDSSTPRHQQSSGAPSTQSVATAPAPSVHGNYRFATGVSANGHYLIDQSGRPYLLVGDSPQCLIGHLGVSDMDQFFADRQRHGFNALWVDLLCGPYTGGRGDFSTVDGIEPFTEPGNLSTPNPQYFARVDAMVAAAAGHGITILLQPAETGSFRDMLRNNGTAKDFAYGAFVGARYKGFPNIIWLSGNDYQTNQWSQYDPYTTSLADGLRSSDPHRLQTVELNYPVSLSTDNPNWSGIIDINAAYTYAPTYADVLRGYNHIPPKPVIMIEANYEGENNAGGPPATAATLRRQEYWTMLSGATGQLYGNHYTWGFQDSAWKDHVDTPGAAQVRVMAGFFSSLPWYDLVPDQGHTLLTSGSGLAQSTGRVWDSDFATAALTADRSMAVVYFPSRRPITVDMSRFRSPVTSRWFDPTNGTYSEALPGQVANAGQRQFEPAPSNSQGDDDWVLVLAAAGANPP
jgi:Protein of unknown function (DUF4038)/Putative collagen-binding domain of a collagenase